MTPFSDEVKIEQKITFKTYTVSPPLKPPAPRKVEMVEEVSHHFITGYDYLELSAIDDGIKYGWLTSIPKITDDQIIVYDTTNKNPKKSTASNSIINWYTMNLTVSRKTGIADRKMSYSFTVKNELSNTTSYMLHEYNVSGNCTLAKNKF